MRAILQMLVIGAALGLVLADDAPLWWSWLWVVGMVTVGAVTAAARSDGVPGVFVVTWVALALAEGQNLAIVIEYGDIPLEPRT